MARETRGSARAADSPSTPHSDTSSKRKRTSAEGSASQEAHGDTHDFKRQRMVNPNGTGDASNGGDVKTEDAGPGRPLSKDVREAIAVVIAQMAKSLPPPINNLLGLALPPDFNRADANTLGYMLKQDSLTWENLVSTIHIFAEHLLAPSSYPNPVPSLARIHLPVPPLPAHLPPLILYSFCTALHQILLQVEPLGDGSSPLDFSQTQERWALMQKTPGNGVGTLSGEWFTTSVDLREVDAAKKKVKIEPGKTLLETLAEAGQKFGYAKPVAVQTSGVLGEPDEKDVPKLSAVVIRRASLKAQRWKELLKARRTGSFHTTLHPVSVPRTNSGGFTPSFAPTYDSSSAAGMGYDSTLDAMHEAARERKYLKETALDELPEKGWKGVLAKKPEKPGDKLEGEDDAVEVKVEESVDDILTANAERIEELQEWQEMRVRKGDASWVSDREQAVADELFASLAKLVENSDTPPSALVRAKPGMAHTLAKRLLANRAPIIRSTLDPARPRALHDNSTIRLRAQAAAQITAQPPSALGLNGVAASPHAPPPKVQQQYAPQMGHSREPPPHAMPNTPRYHPQAQRPQYGSVPAMSPPQGQAHQMNQMRMPYQNQGTPTYRPQTPNYPRTPMTPGAQNASLGPGGQSPLPQTPVGPGSPMPNGPMPQQQQQQAPMQSPMYQRMGPGPSNLRQSYMPGYGSPVQMRMMPQQVSPQVQAAMLGMPIPQQQPMQTPPGLTPGSMTPGGMTPGGMTPGGMTPGGMMQPGMQGQMMQMVQQPVHQQGMMGMPIMAMQSPQAQQQQMPAMQQGMQQGMGMMGGMSPQLQQHAVPNQALSQQQQQQLFMQHQQVQQVQLAQQFQQHQQHQQQMAQVAQQQQQQQQQLLQQQQLQQQHQMAMLNRQQQYAQQHNG